MGLNLILEELRGVYKAVFIPEAHLITYWAVVVYITNSHFHHGLCDKESIRGGDIEEVNVLFLSIQRPLHIDLPLTLHHAQGKPSSGVPSCGGNRASEDLQWTPTWESIWGYPGVPNTVSSRYWEERRVPSFLLKKSMIFICLSCMESKTATFQENKIHLEKLGVIFCLVSLKDNQIQTVNHQLAPRDDAIVFPLDLKRGCITL